MSSQAKLTRKAISENTVSKTDSQGYTKIVSDINGLYFETINGGIIFTNYTNPDNDDFLGCSYQQSEFIAEMKGNSKKEFIDLIFNRVK